MRTSKPQAASNAVDPSGTPGPFYPMIVLTGRSSIPMAARNNGNDIDNTPRQWRRYVDPSCANQLQLNNGMRWGVLSGKKKMFSNTLWLGIAPRIPGQSRGDAAGFHKRGPSPYQVQSQFMAGPGSQPEAPGGPGTLAGMQLYNPMSG
jgi:hypothetical protein